MFLSVLSAFIQHKLSAPYRAFYRQSRLLYSRCMHERLNERMTLPLARCEVNYALIYAYHIRIYRRAYTATESAIRMNKGLLPAIRRTEPVIFQVDSKERSTLYLHRAKLGKY